MATAPTHTLEIVLLFLLIVVAFFAGLARRINIPYPILLVLAGLAISFVPHVPQIPLRPDLFFSIILPPLLYAAAWQTNFRDFQRNLVSISMLAVGLVAFTVLGVALFADHFIRGLDFRSGFLLGAIVAATDAVAATSIARTLGISPRIVSILEGESLVNDATALLALEFGLSLLLDSSAPSIPFALGRFVWLIVGGVGVGIGLGYVMTFVERWIDEGPLEMVVSLIVPYVAYLTAEELKASGVLAVVTCGLFLARRSAKFLSAPARLEILSAWRALDFILNGVVFVLIGLQLPYILGGIRGTSVWTLIFYGAGFAGLLIALRMAWTFPGAHVSVWFRRRILKQDDVPEPRAKAVFLVGWTGMRGVVSLAAAFSLPWTLSNGEPFTQRNLIVFLTFAIIFSTLVLQGLTLPPLIRFLGLNNNRELEQEEFTARCRVLNTAIESLSAKRSRVTEEEAHDIDDMLHVYQHRLEAIKGSQAKADPAQTVDRENEKRLKRRKQLARHTVTLERRTLHEMREDGTIGDEVIRRLERELDLTETKFESLE